MDEQMKNILRYALILFLIAAVVAGLLAGVNLLTKDTIAQNEIAAEQQALARLCRTRRRLSRLTQRWRRALALRRFMRAADAAGTARGYCVKVAQNGYGGAISAVVGVGLDGKVTGVSIISHAETPGLGANIEKDSFRQQYTGKGAVTVVKAGAKESEINAVSGATISSKALTAGVNKAVEVAQQIQNGIVPGTDTNPEGGEVGGR